MPSRVPTLPQDTTVAWRVAWSSPLGWIAVLATDGRLVGITFGHSDRAAALDATEAQAAGIRLPSAVRPNAPGLPEWLADACERLNNFAAGQFEDFADVPIDVGHLSAFERKVVEACRKIGYGATCGYGDLASRVGHAGAARAVGRVMATNRYPLVVPCHRVLASGGKLGGYSAPQGLAMKERLLSMESDADDEANAKKPRRAAKKPATV